MFTKLFKQNNPQAKDLYASALANTRKEIFYRDYGIPDTFDGRFDLLLLHIFIILRRIMGDDNYDELSQDLFDVMFKDMDQTLREMGIGDVGVPKHMKRMMKAFNGRMHAYQSTLVEGLEVAIARNLYDMDLDNKELDKDALNAICAFVHYNLDNYNDIKEFKEEF